MFNNTDTQYKSTDYVSEVLPRYILEDEKYHVFVDILKKYYEYQQTHHTNNIITRQNSYDINNVQLFKSLLYRLLPVVTLDKNRQDEIIHSLIQFAKSFYTNKGNIQSYKFLFRVLFNDKNLEIISPSDYLLRTSDGVVRNEYSIITDKNSSIDLDINAFIGEYVNICDSNTDEVIKRVYIDRVDNTLDTNTVSVVLYGRYDDLLLDNNNKYYINISDDVLVRVTGYTQDTKEFSIIKEHNKYRIYQQYTKCNIINYGKNYKKHSRIIYSIDNVDYDDLPARQQSLEIFIEDVDYLGGIRNINIKPINTKYISRKSNINITFDYSMNETVDVNDYAELELVKGYVKHSKYQHIYKSTLSSNYHLRDKDYWSEYTYTVNTKYPFADSIYNLIKDIIHPAGMRLVFNKQSNKGKIISGTYHNMYIKTLKQYDEPYTNKVILPNIVKSDNNNNMNTKSNVRYGYIRQINKVIANDI